MWNKITVAGFLFAILFGLSAQNMRSGAPTRNDTAKTERKENSEKKNEPVPAYRKINPRKPNMDVNRLNRILGTVYRACVENTWPPSAYQALKSEISHKNRRVTREELHHYQVLLKPFLESPDLEEATGIRRSWYQRIIDGMNANTRAVRAMDRAIPSQNEALYQAARKEFIQNGEKLKAIWEKPPRLTKQEVERIQETNYLRRKNERARLYDQYLREKGKQ